VNLVPPSRRKKTRRICASSNHFYLRPRPKKTKAVLPPPRKCGNSPIEADSPLEPDYDKMYITYIYKNSLADMVGSTEDEDLGSDDLEAYVFWSSSTLLVEYSNSNYDSEEQETRRKNRWNVVFGQPSAEWEAQRRARWEARKGAQGKNP
jgi:hypothetical protein